MSLRDHWFVDWHTGPMWLRRVHREIGDGLFLTQWHFGPLMISRLYEANP